ncbi:MAG: Hpt domain-containing protein, partial [Gemmatimonadales bacterium]|nr:Hpt domain-containing protein [Gemmatimonadales bacterium]
MSAQDDLDAIVRDLQRQYLADAPARLAEIADTLAALAAGDETAPVQLKVLFHRLKGSSGSYGFADVAAVAAELDRRAAAALAPTDAEALREAMRTVDQLFARHIAAFGAAAAAPAALHVLLLADPQAGDAGLGAALTAAGLTVTGATSVAAAAARLEAGAADLLLTAPGVA